MIGRFLAAVVVALVVISIGAALYYWISFRTGDNLFREYLVVYKQYAQTREVELDGRTIEQRYYEVEAQPPVGRWEFVAPVIVVNNLLLLALLSALAVWYSHRISGPIHRIASDINRVLAGEYGIRVRLRRDDEFHELASLVNRLIVRLEEEERN